uniref:Sulfotransferase domain-containing protein n=1 Tax=Pseudo-nitzschia australis TaxID=44445 RepID=A0A7S4AMR1_9STRA
MTADVMNHNGGGRGNAGQHDGRMDGLVGSYGQPMMTPQMMARGRGRGGGRMMARGRGRGRGPGGRMQHPGRGRGGRGRGQQEPTKVPSKLDVFNLYVGNMISQYMGRDVQEQLGIAFPQFRPRELTPREKYMQRKIKEMENKKSATTKDEDKNEAEESANGSDTETNLVGDPAGATVGDSDQSSGEKDAPAVTDAKESEATEAGTLASKSADEPNTDVSEGDGNPKDDTEPEMDPEKLKKMKKERQENYKMAATDCDTLLAQLNTKRLYNRIRYFKRKDPQYDVDKAYPYRQRTEEISQTEWTALIDEYNKRSFEEFKQKIKEQQEAREKREKALAKRAKKFKNKKGKGKKKQDAAKETPDATEGEENKVEGEEKENPAKDDEDLNDSNSKADADADAKSDDVVDTKFEYVPIKPSKYDLLMFTPCPRAVSILASYPRSGNSLMRNLYEKITLRVTGSDMMGGLQKHDLVGEMATGTNKTQFVKTHYPERMGASPFQVSRAVLLVRNPYDAIDSYFNLMTTSSHTTSMTEKNRKKYKSIFAEMAKKEMLVWVDFNEFWLKQKIPILVVRYEDLIRETIKVVRHVIQFVLEIERMTFFEERIHRAIGEEQVEKLGPYKARSGGIGRSLIKGHYTPSLLQEINHGIQSTMQTFGYKEMMVPNPKKWKLRQLHNWGVVIPGSSKEPMIINKEGLVRGPGRQTNWQEVQRQIKMDERAEKKEVPVPVPEQ